MLNYKKWLVYASGYIFGWLILWFISHYWVTDIHYAPLLLPFGFRIGMLCFTPLNLWRWVLVWEGLLWLGLVALVGFQRVDMILLLIPIFSSIVLYPFQLWWRKLAYHWSQLLALLGFIIANTIMVTLLFWLLHKPLSIPINYVYSSAMTTLTGGVLLTPKIYLIFKQIINKSKTSAVLSKKVFYRYPIFFSIIYVFAIGVMYKLFLNQELTIILLVIGLLPNLLMTYHYGWQGAILAALMNTLLLTSAKTATGSFANLQQMYVFTATLALIGLVLGIVVLRQHQLSQALQQANRHLQQELQYKQHLIRQLVDVEENTKKSIANELHDEIGQNITAIQIQATLAMQFSQQQQTRQMAETINELALKIHTSTRQLLIQLRPQILDELGLERALHYLIQEMKFKECNIDYRINIQADTQQFNDVITITLYRTIQELLNNTVKYAAADYVAITLLSGTTIYLEYQDNGVGLPNDWKTKGTGFKGLKERIKTLGGSIIVESQQGLRIRVTVPFATTSGTRH